VNAQYSVLALDPMDQFSHPAQRWRSSETELASLARLTHRGDRLIPKAQDPEAPAMNTRADERHEVVVIGAGQSGLAAGYHLARRGIDFVVLEADRRVADGWRNRYDSLLLYTPAKYDALPGLPFPLPAHAFPSGHEMADYLESYAAHHQLPVRTGAGVDRLRPAPDGGDGYEVVTGDTRHRAHEVIVATGGFQRPFIPEFAEQLDPAIRQLHSADYRNPAQLADGPALVVGVSHSGADLAYELAGAGHSTALSGSDRGQLPFSVDSRRMRMGWPLMRFIASKVMTLDTPVGRRMAPKVRGHGGLLLRVRRADLDRAGVRRHRARTVGVRNGKPLLADGTVLDVANVIWCTGFRPDFSWIELPVLGDDGWPMQQRGVAESAPGLYFLGLPFLYAFASMLVLGAGRDAEYVVDRIASRRTSETATRPASTLAQRSGTRVP
jgi:putative flavoprotein involved in K+ transport